MTDDGIKLSAALAKTCDHARSDGEFLLNSAGWTGSVLLTVDGETTRLVVRDGELRPSGDEAIAASDDDIEIAGTGAQWAALLSAVPPAPFTDPFGGRYAGMQINGNVATPTRHLAIRRLVELLRHARNGTDPAPKPSTARKGHGTFDNAVGRYVHLDLGGIEHRVYFEEAGTGIGLLCQHTAGADGRQWRHLLEDERITSRFRVITYDLPYHGKSIPPEGVAWWAQPYVLTKESAMAVPLALAEVLALDRPVFIGSSVGGMLALDLARYHPDRFRAVIACEAALRLGPSRSAESGEMRITLDQSSDPALHAALMMSWMGATAPEHHRQETRLHYAQGAPGVFSGDINYFSFDHDLTDEAQHIDTSRCAVHLLTGEYDFVTLEPSKVAAAAIKGSTYERMQGMGHFPMSEDPQRFASYVLPLLDAIAEQGNA